MKREKKILKIILVAVILLIICWTPALHAAAPDMGRTVASPAFDTDFKPRLGTYFYCFEFNSINIGNACIAIQKEGDLYRMTVTARTNEKIDYVYKIRYQGRNLTDMDPLSPKETKILQKVKSKEKDIVIRFQGDGSIQTTEKVFKNGEFDDDEERRVAPGRFMVDPFSATYLARGYEWKVGAEQVFTVYTGKNRYELRLKCIDRAVVDRQGLKQDAWVIVPTARGLDKPIDEKKKPSDIRIYLSADERKDVLRVEASHTMGTFLVQLEKFEPSGAPTAGTAK